MKNQKGKRAEHKKAKLNVIAVAMIVIIAVCFILTASGHQSSYMRNYKSNFKRNIAVIAAKMNISVPESWNETDSADIKAEDLISEDGGDIVNAVEPEITPNLSETASQEPKSTASAVPLAPKQEVRSETQMLAMTNAASNEYVRYNNLLLCADKTTLTAYNRNGLSEWSVPAQVSSPILSASGKYIAVAEKGGRKLMLFKEKKLVYSVSTAEDIVRMSVSSRGDTVVVTKKTGYKGAVVVYNRKGSDVFVWNSGTDSILDADISPRGRKLAISLLSVADNIKSTVSFFDITKHESDTSQSYDNCVIFDLSFTGETLSAIGDNKTVGISSSGRHQWMVEYADKTLAHYVIENSGIKLYAYDNHNVSELEFISAGGRKTSSLKAEIIPDYIDIYSGYCVYSSGRSIVFGRMSGTNMKKYTCTKDIHNLIILDDKTVAAIYSTSIEFINMQK